MIGRMSKHAAVYSHKNRSNIPKVSYTGQYNFVDDGTTHWRLELLSSGNLSFDIPVTVDAFLVGGGGGGGGRKGSSSSYSGAGGGGGGYCKTWNGISYAENQNITVTIGAGGDGGTTSGTSGSKGGTTAFGELAVDGGNGGGASTSTTGGNGGGGGSGGGGGGAKDKEGLNGGTAGNDGAAKNVTSDGVSGRGQVNTGSQTIADTYKRMPTYEFYEIDNDASVPSYGAGGKGGNGNSSSNGANGTANSGNGGNGANCNTSTSRSGGKGGSGVVILRDTRL